MITEPTTTLTDYAIALISLTLAERLLRVGWQNQQISVCFWAVAFGFVTIAAALGGTCHGFVLMLEAALSKLLWQMMIYAISLASFCLLAGTIFSSISRRSQPWALLAVTTKSSLIWISLIQLPRFDTAALDYGSAMVIVLLLQLRTLAAAPTRAATWLIAGILVSGLAIVVLISGFELSENFNHNDLYHLVQIIGLGLLYQGAKQLKDC